MNHREAVKARLADLEGRMRRAEEFFFTREQDPDDVPEAPILAMKHDRDRARRARRIAEDRAEALADALGKADSKICDLRRELDGLRESAHRSTDWKTEILQSELDSLREDAQKWRRMGT